MPASAYSKDKYSKWLAGKASMPAVTDRWLCFFVGDPEDGGTEVTTSSPGLSIPRVNITALMEDDDTAGVIASDTLVDFGVGVGALSGVDYGGLYDAAVAGNLIAFGPLTVFPISVPNGVALRIPIGYFSVAST
jgi:hypothetical protein